MSRLRKKSKLFLMLTQSCNFECVYCEASQSNASMSSDVIDRICFLVEKSLHSVSGIDIYFFGGEPLLRPELIRKTVDFFKNDDRVRFFLVTNGSILGDSVVRFIKENNIFVMMSFDGGKETQDYNRPLKDGRTSYDVVAKSISLLDMKGWGASHVTVLMSQYPRTVNFFYRDFLTLLKLGLRNFVLVPTSSGYDRWRWRKNDLLLLENGYKKIKRFASVIKNKGVLIKFERGIDGKKIGPADLVDHSICIDVNGDVYSTNGFLIVAEADRDLLLMGNIFKDIDLFPSKRKIKTRKLVMKVIRRREGQFFPKEGKSVYYIK